MPASFVVFCRRYLVGFGILVMSAWLNTLLAATHLQSGPERVTVVELYTSQGCNSCPPADEWFEELADHPGLWTDFVPVAFHVDYWDYIGWKDRFADPEFGVRQSRYRDERGVSAVYTPGIVVNGSEWHGWRTNPEPPTSLTEAGLLTAEFAAGFGKVRYSPVVPVDSDLVANIAVLGFGLESKIDAGENRGHTLRNDFVVLGLASATMEKADRDFAAAIRLPATRTLAERYAVVAWVSSSDQQAPLQAAGGWYLR